jgi:xanthine/uracil permease
MGFQHCLAMTGGLITPPLLIGALSPDPVVKTYLVQAAMLTCGITTFIQVYGFKFHPRLPQLGSGILSVMGVSFASVTIFQTSISEMMRTDKNTFNQAFGRMMGTCAICCIVPLLISFLPYKIIKRVFPPVVLGVTIMLIGIKLVGGSGFFNWGGGSFCGNNYQHLPTTRRCTIYNATGFPSNSTCFVAQQVLCAGNGFVLLPFGSAVYIGLGFLVSEPACC